MKIGNEKPPFYTFDCRFWQDLGESMSKLEPSESAVHIAGLPLMDDEQGQQVNKLVHWDAAHSKPLPGTSAHPVADPGFLSGGPSGVLTPREAKHLLKIGVFLLKLPENCNWGPGRPGSSPWICYWHPYRFALWAPRAPQTWVQTGHAHPVPYSLDQEASMTASHTPIKCWLLLPRWRSHQPGFLFPWQTWHGVFQPKAHFTLDTCRTQSSQKWRWQSEFLRRNAACVCGFAPDVKRP